MVSICLVGLFGNASIFKKTCKKYERKRLSLYDNTFFNYTDCVCNGISSVVW